MIYFTAPTIRAGISGTILLELANFGLLEWTRFPEAPICQLIVETMAGQPSPKESQFQGQSLSTLPF